MTESDLFARVTPAQAIANALATRIENGTHKPLNPQRDLCTDNRQGMCAWCELIGASRLRAFAFDVIQREYLAGNTQEAVRLLREIR